MSSALREILAKFDVDTAMASVKLDAVGKTLEHVAGTLGALTEAFVGSALVHGLREFVEGQIEAGSRINDLSEKLGIGTDDLQAFQFAAGQVGVGAEEAAKSLQFLNKNVGEALDGNKEAAETFAKLGIALKDSNGDVRQTNDLVPEIADAFEAMGSDAERTAVAMKVFGKSGASLLPLLKDGAKGAKALYEEFNRLGGGMSQDFIKKADEAGDELDKLKFAFNGWKSQIAQAILPYVIKFAKYLQAGIVQLRGLTRESRVAEVAWLALGAAGAAAGFKAAAGFAKMIGVLPKGASFWETVLGLGEIGLVILGVVLLALAFEDLYTFLTGGDSVIGDIIEDLFGVGASKEVIEEVRKTFKDFQADLETFKPIVEEFKQLFGGMWPYIAVGIKFVARTMMTALALSLRIVLGLIKSVLFQLGGLIDGVGQLAEAAGDFMGVDAISNLGAKLSKTGMDLSNVVVNSTQAKVAPSALEGSATRMTHAQIINNVDVTVQGGNSPKETGDRVADGVQRAIITETDQTTAFGAINTGGD